MNYDDCYDDLYTVCIFPFLNFKDLYSISLTCKYFSTLYKYSKHKNQDVIDYFKIIFLSNMKKNFFILQDICTFGILKSYKYSNEIPNGIYFFSKILYLNNNLQYFYNTNDTNHTIMILIFIINKKHITYIVYKYQNFVRDIQIEEEKILNENQYILKVF